MDTPLRLLLVEDEPFVALDLQMLLTDVGHEVVGVAEDTAEALSLADSEHPEAALVDVKLRDGPTGPDIGRALLDRGVRVVFVTGNPEMLPADLKTSQPVVDKPFSLKRIEDALERVRAA